MPERVIGFAGSLRKKSYNRALLEAARELAPQGMLVETIVIGDLPFYNADVEALGDPPSVAAFKAALQQADGILIATPEYNDGIPGVLGNAMDWGSRLHGRSPLIGKPAAVMGESPTQLWSARPQHYLRQILGHVHARTLPPPELLVARAHERFDKDLRLTDESTRKVLRELLVRFTHWIERERRANETGREKASV